VLTAKDALAVGMVDGIETLDDVLGELLSNGGTLSSTARASMRLSSPTPRNYDPNLPHGEPGTGSPPEIDPEIHPPSELVEDDYSNGERFEKPEVEESLMGREQLLEYAARLGITNAESLDDEALATAVSDKLDTALDQVEELNEAIEQAARTRSFASDYPDEYNEMQKIRAERRENAAKLYAGKFGRLTGEDGKPTKFGLSLPVREKIEEAHLAMAMGEFGENELTEIVNLIASKNAVVEFGEKGSSRLGNEHDDSAAPTGDRVADRKAFAQKVKEIMEEDSLDRKAAISLASERYPELARAYANS